MKREMKNVRRLDRRSFLARGLAGASFLVLTGCDRPSASPTFLDFIGSAEKLTQRAQRFLQGQRLAPEFSEDQISKAFRANGTISPEDPDYLSLARSQFSDWKLIVNGLVEHPGQFSLAELRAMPSRTQITRHDCVEGWSCIGKWKGALLAELLRTVGVKPHARYVIFHCADTMDEGSGLESNSEGPKYYESIDLIDAHHPQTILAYEMNGETLPVAYGAPLRLRVERQLGYKMAKYIMRIELADDLAAFGQGKGGYWEDNGYEWYAGI
jgi:DMSO/TMAO reductase YedYZ molybdopterin-dependent catalytic subunit